MDIEFYIFAIVNVVVVFFQSPHYHWYVNMWCTIIHWYNNNMVADNKVIGMFKGRGWVGGSWFKMMVTYYIMCI